MLQTATMIRQAQSVQNQLATTKSEISFTSTELPTNIQKKTKIQFLQRKTKPLQLFSGKQMVLLQQEVCR